MKRVDWVACWWRIIRLARSSWHKRAVSLFEPRLLGRKLRNRRHLKMAECDCKRGMRGGMFAAQSHRDARVRPLHNNCVGVACQAISRYFPDKPIHLGEAGKPIVQEMITYLSHSLGGINKSYSFKVPEDAPAQTDESEGAKFDVNNVRLQRTLMLMCGEFSGIRRCGVIQWTNHVVAIFAEPDPPVAGSAAAGGKVRITAYDPKQPADIMAGPRPPADQFAANFFLNEAYKGSAIRFAWEDVPTIPILRKALYGDRGIGNEMKMLSINVFNEPLPERVPDEKEIEIDSRGHFFPKPGDDNALRKAITFRNDMFSRIAGRNKWKIEVTILEAKSHLERLKSVVPVTEDEKLAHSKEVERWEKRLTETTKQLLDHEIRERAGTRFPEADEDRGEFSATPNDSILRLVNAPAAAADEGGAADAAAPAAAAPAAAAPAAPPPPSGPAFGQGKPVSNIHEAMRKFQMAKRMLHRATNSADSENPRLMASLRDALQKRYQTYLAFKEGMVVEPRTYKPWHRSNAENAARQAHIEAAAEAPPRRHRKMAPLPSADELMKMKGGSKSSGFIQRMLAENSRYHYVNPNGKRRRAGHEWPVSKRRSYGWIRGTEAADEDETDPRGQPNYMTMEQILATYPPDSEERGRYLATLLDDSHPEMKEFRQFDPYGQQDWRNEMVNRSDWITDKFPQPPSSSEDEGESDSDQEPPPEDDEEDEEEDQYHQGHDPDPEPPAQPARVRRRGISPVERRDLGPVVTGPRRPRRSRRLQGGAGGSRSGSETDSESEGERHARIHEEGRLRGGMLAFRRMQEAKHVAADRSCFNQTAAFHSHYHPEVKNFYYKTYEPSHNGKYHGIKKVQGIMRFEEALGIKATQYEAIDDKEIPQPGLRAVLLDAQEKHYSGTVHTIGHIFPFTYDPETGTLAFYDPPQEREVRLAKQAGEAIHSGFTHIDARTLPRKYNLHNLAIDTHPNTDEIIFIRAINVYEIPVSTRPGTHRFDPQTKHGFYVRDAKPNPDEDFDDPDFEIFLKERYKEENAEPPHKRAKVES